MYGVTEAVALPVADGKYCVTVVLPVTEGIAVETLVVPEDKTLIVVLTETDPWVIVMVTAAGHVLGH